MSSSIAGYNKYGYTSSGWILYSPAAPALTTDEPYNANYGRLLKPKFELWDKDEQNLLLTYNAFDPDASNFVPDGLNIIRGNQSNSFTLSFFDGEKFLDASDIRYGTKLKVWAGKADNSDEMLPLFIGYTSDRYREGYGPDARNYTISGIGEQAATNKYVAALQRAARSLVVSGELPRLPDHEMVVSNLFKILFTSQSVRVGGGRSIADLLKLDIAGIDDKVDQFIASINEFDTVANIANRLTELGGASWRIEFGKLILEYPRFLKPRFTVKSIREQGDRSEDTAYILQDNPWSDLETTSFFEGHASTIYTNTAIDAKEVAGQNENNASMILYNRGIAQMFTALDNRFNTIFLKLSRIGDPSGGDLDVKLTGDIRVDNPNIPGYLHHPSGPTIKNFEIEVGGIDDLPSNIFINDLNISQQFSSPNANYWINLDPLGPNLYNTVRWHHNNSNTDLGSYSAWAISTGKDIIDPSSWRLLDRGPTFDFGVFATINRLQRYTADTTEALIGATESIENFPFLDDSVSTAKMMQNVLGFRSLIPRKFFYSVTVPDKLLPLPGMYVNTVDDLIDAELAKFITGEIQEANYNWTTQGSEGLGLDRVSIRVQGFSDPLEDELV